MFLTRKKTISVLAFPVALTIALTACTGTKVSALGKTTVMESVVESPSMGFFEAEQISSSKPEFRLLINEYYNSGKTVEEILNGEVINNILYPSALYMKLREFGLDDETIQKELYNVINFGLVHPYADGWKNDLLVENLNKSLNYSEDAIIYFYPLAVYVHLFNCKEDHIMVDDRLCCEKIQDDLMKMNEGILFANYIVENAMSLSDDDPIKLAMKRIVDSKEDTETCIYELESVYELAMVPRCVTEEEWNSVSHLCETLNEGENPFEVYYKLAAFAHILGCEDEHYLNEYGQWECNSVRQKLENRVALGK